MAYKCMLMDNDVYSANDVNEALSKLTSSGTVSFNDTGSTLSDINDAISNYTAGGVTSNPDSCMVVKNGDVFYISEGECFMNDGSLIIFSDGGEQITVPEDTACYVYLKRNAAQNTIDIEVSQAAGDSESIPLAEIDAQGNITDKRIFSVCKVMPSGQNISVSGTFTKTLTLNQTETVNLGFTGFKFFLYKTNASYPEWEAVDLSDGEEHNIRFKNLYSADIDGIVKKEGSNLIFRGTYSSGLPYNLKFEVR